MLIISIKLNIMSSKQNEWLEEQKAQFDLCLKSGSYEDIMEAYEVILEVEHQGFKDEGISLQNAWDSMSKPTTQASGKSTSQIIKITKLK